VWCFRCSRDGAEVAFARRQAHLPPLLRQCKECFHASCSSAAVVVAEGGVAAAEEEEEEDPRCWREVQIIAFVLELGLSQAQAEGVAAAAPNGCVFLALSGTKLKKIPVLLQQPVCWTRGRRHRGGPEAPQGSDRDASEEDFRITQSM